MTEIIDEKTIWDIECLGCGHEFNVHVPLAEFFVCEHQERMGLFKIECDCNDFVSPYVIVKPSVLVPGGGVRRPHIILTFNGDSSTKDVPTATMPLPLPPPAPTPPPAPANNEPLVAGAYRG